VALLVNKPHKKVPGAARDGVASMTPLPTMHQTATHGGRLPRVIEGMVEVGAAAAEIRGRVR